MSLLANLVKSSTTLNLTRSYTKVVNVFGRRTVDTTQNEKELALNATIPEAAERVKELSSMPEEAINGRIARIFVQAKNSMQSGTFQQRKWRIEFDNQERWENPNMGWGSSGDPLSNLYVEFSCKEDAALYCKRMGYEYTIEEPRLVNKRIKSYGGNFSWNKNTRRANK